MRFPVSSGRGAGAWPLVTAGILAIAVAGCSESPESNRPAPGTSAGASDTAPATAPSTGEPEDGLPPEAPPPADSAPASEPPASAAMNARWLASYDWSLEVEGAVSWESQFFQERGSNRLLIVVPGMNEAGLLDQNGRKILALPRDRVTLHDEGESADIASGSEETAQSSGYTIDETRRTVIFYLGDRRLKILSRQPLVGAATVEEILQHSPLYRKGIEDYVPSAADVEAVRGHRGDVSIEVWFGTWCPHCKVVIPRFIKTIQQAANPALSVSYVGVPRQFSNYPQARAKGVRTVPTIIFYRDGREFGRLPGPEGDTIERGVARLLAASR